MSAIPTKAALQAGVEAVHTQAAGALEVVVVMQSEVSEVIAAALGGDPKVMQVAQMTMQTLHQIRTAPQRRPLLCACCPQPLRPGGRFSFAMALPACDAPMQALGLAICGRCATEPQAVQAKAVEALRQIWPDLRTANVTHPEGGRA